MALYAGAAVWALEKAAARYTAKSKAIQFVMIVAVMGFSLTGALFHVAYYRSFDARAVQPLGLRPQSIRRICKGCSVHKEEHQTGRPYRRHGV